MPPVTLPAAPGEQSARPRLRLVRTADAGGGPGHAGAHTGSCPCRECTMARHPAAGAKLTLVHPDTAST